MKNFIDEYISLGHARVIPLTLKNKNSENKYFMPHHCVIREESSSTKLRVVFDAGMKTYSNLSLNDIMYKGFTVQPDLFDILCRFRSFKYALTADIQKMYRKIRINPSQTFLQNILWRNDPSEPLQCIELLTVTYGTNSAPYLATRVLNELASTSNCTLASTALLEQTYVDDIICGANTLNDLRSLYSELSTLLNSAQLQLHKWNSNNLEFLKTLDNSSQSQYELHSENSPNKVLGILWNPSTDQFSVSVPKRQQIKNITKKQVLSKISQIYDPLGFVTPVTVVAKLIMQKLWIDKLDWNSTLNESLLKEWNIFYENLPQLKNVKIPRYFVENSEIFKIELHGFSDASTKAYGTCAYIRILYKNKNVSCHLIASKSRVCPIKPLTIPRLELSAALLLTKLVQKLLEIFERKLSFHSINLWTDSKITLAWINSHPSKWNTFVANRVMEIQQLTENTTWHYVPSLENPADCLSRGLTPNELSTFTLWWSGPQFLHSYDTDINTLQLNTDEVEIPEKKKIKTIMHIVKENFWYSLFLKFSSWGKLQRVIAFCLRFVNNIKPSALKTKEPLTPQELKISLYFIVKILQENCFEKELAEFKTQKPLSNKAILQLNPFIDDSGILRVGGRLTHSNLPFEQKHPMLLPSKNKIVRLLLTNEHIRLGHSGLQTTLSNFRLRFWPLGGLREVKRIARNCFICHKFKVKPFQQIMSDLPSVRVQPSRPFNITGVDFGGPLFIKSSHLRKAPLLKCYFAVFVCMVTKAVHIEVVSDLSTEAFILSLKRFISRRGFPHTILSDNATNFQGANNQLHELYTLFKKLKTKESIKEFLSQKEIQWKFIAPLSTHFCGMWESSIKSTKYHLRRLVGESRFTFEELSTILTQIEAILNSRPLLPLSSDPTELNVLTPGHFLIGNSLVSFPERDVSEHKENRLNRWQRCTQVQQLFWKRWSKEYLNLLTK